MDNYYVSKLLPLIAEAGVSAIPNPLINIVLQGRHDTYPKRRGMTRVPEMIKAGIRVGFGQDCVLDPWYSLGTADMLDVAFMGLHVAQMTSPADMRRCFDMVTSVNAAIMGLDGYGLAVGSQASLVVLDAGNPIEAIRLRPERLCVIAKGKIVATRRRQDTRAVAAWPADRVNRRHQAGARTGIASASPRLRHRRLVWQVRLLRRRLHALVRRVGSLGLQDRHTARRQAARSAAVSSPSGMTSCGGSVVSSESNTRTYWTSSTSTMPSPGICMVRCLPSLHTIGASELPSGHACSRQSTSWNQLSGCWRRTSGKDPCRRG